MLIRYKRIVLFCDFDVLKICLDSSSSS